MVRFRVVFEKDIPICGAAIYQFFIILIRNIIIFLYKISEIKVSKINMVMLSKNVLLFFMSYLINHL